jgi:hypothetical protein
MSVFSKSAYVILLNPYVSSLNVAEKFRSFIEKEDKEYILIFVGFINYVVLLFNLKSKKFLTNSLFICYVLNVEYKRRARLVLTLYNYETSTDV